MSADVTQILSANRNIIFKSAAGDILKIMPSQNTFAHPSAAPNSNIIQFNNSPDRLPSNESFYIKVDQITTPAGPWTQQTLLEELQNNYINTPVTIDLAAVIVLLTDLLACCNQIDANTDQIEAKLDAQIVLLTSLEGKDFATETTLAAILASANNIITELTTLNGVSFATEPTLAAIKAQTDLLTFTGSDLNVSASISFPAGVQRPIELIEATVNGSTTAGVQSVSLAFDGKDGTLDGVTVPDKYIASYGPNGLADTVGSIAYTMPTNKGQRVLITYVKVS